MIEIQLTLEARRVFNSPCQRGKQSGEKPANISQLCRGSVNSSVRSVAFFSSFLDSTLYANHHFSFAVWTTVMKLLLYCPRRSQVGSLELIL